MGSCLSAFTLVKGLSRRGEWCMCSLPELDSDHLNRPGMSGDSTCWEGWSHVGWFVEEVSAGAA
jgi:hypothetical protein